MNRSLIAILLVAALAACTSGETSAPNSASPATTSASSATTSASPATTAPKPIAAPTSTTVTPSISAIGVSSTIECSGYIAIENAVPDGFEVVLDVVALPTSAARAAALQTGATGQLTTDRLFAKTGLLIRAGASFELSVPPEWVDRLSIGWGSPADPSDRLIVPGCEPPSTINPGSDAPDRGTVWLAYPGGYWVTDPACVTIDVDSAGQAQSVSIGVGVACPGQEPPPQPSET